jgi:preprotein translocase SecE subunit
MAAETKKERKATKSKEEGNFLTNTITNIRTYFGEVRSELNKVSWPERADVIRLTRIVLLVTIISGLFLGAISIFFSKLVEFGIESGTNNWLVFVVIFLVIIGITIYWFRRDNQKTGY